MFDDVILDEPSKAALTHVPGGRDALLILGFPKNNCQGIRLTEERAALSEDTKYSAFATAVTSQPWKSTELRSQHPGIRFDCRLD